MTESWLLMMTGSETDLESTHGCKAGHSISAVYSVTGVSNIFQTCEQINVAAYLVCQFQIEKCIILHLHIIGHIQSARAFQVGRYLELIPEGKLRPDIVLMRGGAHKIAECGVQVAVGCEYPQIVQRIAAGRDLYTLVDEASGVDILHIHGLYHIRPPAVVKGNVA